MDTADPYHENALNSLMLDTNTAISALFDAGVDVVCVVDGHGAGKNFPQNSLDSRATQVWMKDMEWVVKEICAVVMIGMHAMAGTQNAFLDHTQSSATIHHYFYNDKRIGELSQMGVFVGHFGIPVVAVSGDKAACNEAREIFDGVYTASVKESTERNVATCLSEKLATELIYEAVKNGYENRSKVKPLILPLPFTVKVEFNRCDYCDNACRDRSDVERVDGFTARTIKRKS